MEIRNKGKLNDDRSCHRTGYEKLLRTGGEAERGGVRLDRSACRIRD